jgi:hypothetical protein
MSPSALTRSAAAAALALLLAVAPARAENGVGESGKAVLHSGLSFIRKMLHLGQQDGIVSHSISVGRREATLELETATGRTRSLSLRGGQFLLDGTPSGRYEAGGQLERSWRRLLADGANLETPRLVASLRAWRVRGLAGDDAAAMDRIADVFGTLSSAPKDAAVVTLGSADTALPAGPGAIRLGDLEALGDLNDQLGSLQDAGVDVAAVVRSSPLHIGSVTVGAGERLDGNLVVYRGNADVFGTVTGDVVALFGNVAFHRGGLIGRNAVSIGGEVQDRGGTVRGDLKTISEAELRGQASAEAAPVTHPRSTLDHVFDDVRNTLAVFVAFAMLGFGTVFLGRRYLEVVADTAAHSFGRSLVVGVLGQLLLLPTLAMLIVGLAFTIVGILLLPFAVIAYAAAAVLAAVGGYLAVAHAIGESFTRRRMARGAFVRAPNAYGYLFTGLLGLMGLWAAAALTGWMGPIVIVFRVAAVIVTWLAATVGFGAVLLARGGLRETFAGRHLGEMSDEYLWATPPATPTASRPGSRPSR